MTDNRQAFPGVHLCGSLPFANGPEAFRWIRDELKPWVHRVPDETGARAGFIFTQRPLFVDNPAFEPAEPNPEQMVPLTCVRLRSGTKAEDVHFERFGYADAAQSSFQAFQRAKQDGDLAADARFLFPMPSPLNPVHIFVEPHSLPAVFPAYERQAQAAVDEILEKLPHSELAIQWDVPIEVVTWEGMTPNPLGSRENLLESMLRLGRWIPDDVELGYHLCYGDSEVFAHPSAADTATLAVIWMGLVEGLARRIDFVHMPTAIDWTSGEHYAPLAAAPFDEGTELYLGVVHHQDGVEGARKRATAAASVLKRRFGISTECGMGRYGSHEKFEAAAHALRDLAGEKSPSRA